MAHLTEAGADIFLMPSKYEPCGLNQMYSLRYGTVPIVRSTGGLADTVTEYNPENRRGNGFVFTDYDVEQFKAAIDRALLMWPDETASGSGLMLNGMQQEFSWNQSARKYLEAYRAIGRDLNFQNLNFRFGRCRQCARSKLLIFRNCAELAAVLQ